MQSSLSGAGVHLQGGTKTSSVSQIPTSRDIETGPLAVSLSYKLIVGKLSRYCKISQCPTDSCNQATVSGRQWLKKHLVMTLTTTTNKFLLGKLVLCCQVGPGPASQLSSATGQSLQSHLATRSPERAQSHNTTSSYMRSEGDSGDTVTQAP